MTSLQRFPMAIAGVLLLGSAAYAQSVISAKSGLIHYTEGDVFLQDKLVESTGVKFPEMKNGDILRTQDGRAEVLLTPGSLLWMKEQSSIKMVSNRLAHTSVEVLSGSVVVECPEATAGSEVVLLFKDATIEFGKKGLVRIDTDPAAVKVYSGDAIVTRAGESVTLKEGRQTLLTGVMQPEKFDNKVGDSFYRWAARRDAALASANLAAARSADKYSGQKVGGFWGWNQWLGMFTYIPYSGRYYSPFGSYYFSPYSVGGIYDYYYYGGSRSAGSWNSGSINNNIPTFNSSVGYNTVSRGSESYSTPGPVSSGVSAVAAPSAGRGADAGGGAGASRGDSGGGRGGR